MSADEMYGDYPALCNCDDPESHDGAVTAAGRPSITDNARDEEPLAWCPGCGDRIPTEVIRERGVCSNCYGTSDDPWATDQALAEAWAEGHRTGWEHCQDGNYGNDHWDDPTPNPYAVAAHTDEETRAAMGRRRHLAEMTRQAFADGLYETSVEDYAEALRRARGKNPAATTEDAARVLDEVIQNLRKVWSTGHDEAREVIDTAEELLAQALPRLLATARTLPTRDDLDRVISDGLRKHGVFRTDLIADAVLALFRGGDK